MRSIVDVHVVPTVQPQCFLLPAVEDVILGILFGEDWQHGHCVGEPLSVHGGGGRGERREKSRHGSPGGPKEVDGERLVGHRHKSRC